MSEETQNKLLNAFKELVGLFDSKPRAAAITAMLLTIVFLYMKVDGLQQLRVEDNDKWREREVQLYQNIINRYDPKIRAMEQSTDSTKEKVDSTTRSLVPVIKHIKENLGLKKK